MPSYHSSIANRSQRLGTCPKLGCVFPPDQADFLAGQYFDIRLEVHAPDNGSEKAHDGKPDEAFAFTITGPDGKSAPATTYFKVEEPKLEKWNFTWYEVSAKSKAHYSGLRMIGY